VIVGRWILAILFGLLWLLIAIQNGRLEWRTWIRKEERVESVFPLVGGFFAYLATMICPWESPQKYFCFWLAVILDVGCLPYLFLCVVAVIKERMEKNHGPA
jgi:hypothetical protein